MTSRTIRSMGLVALACLLAPGAATQLRASADGIPRLDATNGGAGTNYIFVMPQISRTMDPGAPSNGIAFRGSFTLYQDLGSSSFDVENMQVDTNGDTFPDRTLKCSGWNGLFRFGMECSDDDGGDDIHLVITGRAIQLINGKIVLRRASGHGVTETHLMLLNFAAASQ